jgi:DNA-binding ferritin-like protein (Dps family)
MKKEIKELETRIDKLPKEANWFGNVDAIKILISKIKSIIPNG